MDNQEQAEPIGAHGQGGDSSPTQARELQVASSDEEGTRVIALRGELDLASVPLLEREIDSALADSASALVIDLSELRFMDSTGLRTLILGQRRARDVERGFVIARRPDDFVARVLKLA